MAKDDPFAPDYDPNWNPNFDYNGGGWGPVVPQQPDTTIPNPNTGEVPTPWDIAHTPNGRSAPPPNPALGAGTVVRNWNDPSQWINNVTGEVMPGPTENKPGGAPGAPGPSTNLNNSQVSGASSDLINLLMKRAQGSLNIDPTTDPIIRPQVDNYAATQERSRRNYLNTLAESSNPYSTGAAQTAATQTAETAGQNTANMQSQLVNNELTARRNEIQQALTELGSFLTGAQSQALHQELGLINASLQKQQLGSQNDMFLANLGLQTTNQNNYWDAVRTGLLG